MVLFVGLSLGPMPICDAGALWFIKLNNDEDDDVLTMIIEEKCKLYHAEELGDTIVHFGEDGKTLFMEILRASKTAPLMVEGLAKKSR